MSDLLFPSTPGSVYVRRTLLTRTEVDEADDGKVFTVGKYPILRYRYAVEWRGLRQAEAYQEAQRIWRHFSAHGGRRESFRLLDPDDFTVSDHGFGVGDGAKTKFPLQRTPIGSISDATGTWSAYTKPRTNLVVRSTDFTNAAWTKLTGVTIASYYPAPDGTLTAQSVSYDGSGSAGGARLSQGISVAPNGQSRVSSLWVRADAPVTLRLDANLAGGAGMQTMSITTSWQRCSAWGIGNGTDTSQVTIYSPVGINTAFAVYMWGPQHEPGSVPTRYIPSPGATAVTETPAYWTVDQTTSALIAPGTSGGFEPVTDLQGNPALQVFKDGVDSTGQLTGLSGGVVTFSSAPASGVVLSWTGNFYRRVRFDDDELDFERIVQEVKSGAVELVSVV